MRPWPLLASSIFVLGAFWPVTRQATPLPAPSQGDQHVFLIGGDMNGYLSPCGCTKPMAGGIKRKVAAFRAHLADHTTILENGGIVAGRSRQDELKAEAVAEALAGVPITAINLGQGEARLGKGAVLSMRNLSMDALVSSSMADSPTNDVPALRRSGDFLIAAVEPAAQMLGSSLGERPVSTDRAIQNALAQSEQDELGLVVMLRADRAEAVRIARAFPRIDLIVYRSSSDPPAELEREGNVLLATPGDSGKHVVKLVVRNGTWHYQRIKLLPEVGEEPRAARIFRAYLQRVGAEGLLDKLPRSKTAPYSGSASCAPCHGNTHKSWRTTKHAKALKTLEIEGHQRDPDCVGCHVTGLNSTSGFRSRIETPRLSDVGCESCHGPGRAHARSPLKVKLGKVGEKSCVKCHTSNTSPGFNYPEYWRKIAHR